MIGLSDRHRARRFFSLRGVVRSRRRSRAADDDRPPRPLPTDADRALQSERARFAAKLDVELRLACRTEAATRRELGDAARAFMRGRGYRRLGFVRLSDYARERLGVSARTLQVAAWLVTRLDALPAVSRAYDRSELSWAQARAICKVAVAADEDRWLEIARHSTVETLDHLVARARHPDGVPPDPTRVSRPDDVPPDPAGEPNEIDGEPAVRWRFVCPARVRALWRRALELASRAAGEPLAEWRAAEVVAAEGSSGRPAGGVLGDRALIEAVRRARRDVAHRIDSSSPSELMEPRSTPTVQCNDPAPESRAATSDEPTTLGDRFALDDAAPPSDPFALDARLSEALRVLRTIEPRIGQLLRVVVDQRIYRSFGYPTLADYVRERLGISARKAWALLKVEKATLRSGDFASAYREGRLSWVRALSLLPVLDRQNAPAWIARAETVTVRRLNDEIEWVLASRDVLGPTALLAPPPMDSPLPAPFRDVRPERCRDLSSEARVQIRTHEGAPTAGDTECQFASTSSAPASASPPALEVCDVDIRFAGPASVVALLRDVIEAFADPHQPRWTALERLLRHVVAHWESTPRHPDPVFARDGWRCTVPACSSRRNLHDHHIRFRSRGGDNARDNRTTVCAAHHLHGIHDGTIQALGTAPRAIEWRLGARPDAPPFLHFVGDRYCSKEVPDGMVAHARASGRS
jgi:hypothetical protein